MMSISPIANPGEAFSYYSDSDNYYFIGQLVNEWLGEGAELCDLSGELNKQEFEKLIQGEMPDGSRLGRFGPNGEMIHRPGFDLTFSAPKSVSILALAGGEHELMKMHERAVKAAFNEVEAMASARISLNKETHLEAKGITSVRSRVTNLCDLKPELDHQRICDAIMEAFFNYYDERVEPELISVEKIPALPKFEETFARQSQWEWNFGKTPEFMYTLDERFQWGNVELHLDVKQAQIERAKIFSDSLHPESLEAFADALTGKAYQVEEISQTVAQISNRYPNQLTELMELQSWLQRAVA